MNNTKQNMTFKEDKKMNINVELIKEFAEFHKRFLESGALNTRMDYMSAEIQVSESELVGIDNLQIANRKSDIYPYEVFTMIDGVKIFSVVDKKEVSDLFPEFKQLLKEQKDFLEEDVDLSGMESGDRIA
jgi:hypothetical protein